MPSIFNVPIISSNVKQENIEQIVNKMAKLEEVSTSSLIHADFLVMDEGAHSSMNYRKYPFCLSQASMDESVNQINILMCEG